MNAGGVQITKAHNGDLQLDSIGDLEYLLEVARKDERIRKEEIHKTKAELRKAFLGTCPYNYVVTGVRATSFDVSWTIGVEIQDKIYVAQKIDPDWYHTFTCKLPADEQEVLAPEELNESKGMQYYLTMDGIIHNTGGGTLILKTPQLCSSDEWAQIKSGNIPPKFLRNGE